MTLSLSRTHARLTALLDFPASLALAYAQAQARHFGDKTVPSSAIVRRALLVYALHIEQQARDQEAGAMLAEWRAIKAAALGGTAADLLHSTGTEQDARQQALERLQAIASTPTTPTLPSFKETLYGPAVVAARAAMHAELERKQEALHAPRPHCRLPPALPHALNPINT